MHLLHHRRHGSEGVVVGVDDHVDTVPEDVQFAVGDKGGDLDEFVAAQSQPGHLAVDPHKFVLHPSP